MIKFEQLSPSEINIRDSAPLVERLLALIIVAGSIVVITFDVRYLFSYTLMAVQLATQSAHLSVKSEFKIALMAVNGLVLCGLAVIVVAFTIFKILKIDRFWTISSAGISFERRLFGARLLKKWAYSSVDEAVLEARSSGMSVTHRLVVSMIGAKPLRLPSTKNDDIVAGIRRIINQHSVHASSGS